MSSVDKHTPPKLIRIIIRLNLQIWDSLCHHCLLDIVCLNRICMTGLQNDLQHTVNLIVVNHLTDVVHTRLVRTHNRAVDIQIFLGKCSCHRKTRIYLLNFFACTIAAVKCNNISTEKLNCLDGFLTHTAVRTPSHKNSRAGGSFSFVIFFPVFAHFLCTCLNNITTLLDIRCKYKRIETCAHLISR